MAVGAGHYAGRMLIGAHVREDDPVASAADRGADIVQMFLADPQGWKKPPTHPQAQELRASDVAVVVHSPYVVNLASTNNRIRIPSRKVVVQHAEGAAEVGAIGLVVHGGHVTAKDDPAVGVDNWRKFISRQQDEGGFAVPILLENTAGGDFAMARHLDALDRLWNAIGEFGVGFCLDTCHAFAAGHDLVDVVDRVKAITGRIDLVHLNNSRDEFGSGQDRHANVAERHHPGRAARRRVRRRRGAGRRGDPGGGPGRRRRVPARAARAVTRVDPGTGVAAGEPETRRPPVASTSPAVGRGRLMLAVIVLLTGLTLLVGYANKARCTGPEFDQAGRSQPDYDLRIDRDVCYSDIQHLWLGRDIDKHVFPFVNGSITPEGQLKGGTVEYPVLTGLLIWAGAIFAHDDAEYLLGSALLMAPFGLLTGWMLGRLARWRALLWALGPPLVLYAFHNWDLPVVACAVGAVYVVHGWRTSRPLADRATIAAVLLGIGFAFKLYPGAFLLPLALYVLVTARRAGSTGLRPCGCRSPGSAR